MVGTRRQALEAVLRGCSTEDFVFLLVSNISELDNELNTVICDECQAAHGGECPHPADDACTVTMEAWLDGECTDAKPIYDAVARCIERRLGWRE